MEILGAVADLRKPGQEAGPDHLCTDSAGHWDFCHVWRWLPGASDACTDLVLLPTGP